MKYVYIIKAGEDRYKVGISLNVGKRLNSIQTGNGHKVYIVTAKLCNDAQKVEKELHRHLKAMGSGGGTEWFVLDPEEVLRLCIRLHMEPEIDVYANTDLNRQLLEQNLRHKRLEHKLDSILNIAQSNKVILPLKDDITNIASERLFSPKLSTEQLGEIADTRLFHDAMQLVRKEGKASTSLLQRKLRIGYGRAARIIEQLEEQGIIGAADGSRARKIIVEAN